MDKVFSIKISKDTILRQIQESDAADMFRAIDTNRKHLGKWLPFVEYTRSESDSLNYIRSVMNVPEPGREYVFVIRHEDRFAGLVGFKLTDRDNHKTEIGYWLAEEAAGKGIITESVRTLLLFAFSELGMNRVQIKCAVGNDRSRRVPQRLGFSFEGIERAGELLTGGCYVDIEVYSILACEKYKFAND